ncbi:MAG: quinol monooxygenase YgiN [Celeribacter sp.]|jgi:quinol monooxygenase YgiN
MTQLVILARISAKSGREAVVGEALQDLAIPTRMEHGCLRYDIYQNPKNSGVFLIHELWESHALWRVHVATEHLQNFKDTILSSQAEMTVEKLISSS